MKYFDAFGKEVTDLVESLIAENKALQIENGKLVASAERKARKVKTDG
jgi:regulator of replication initiation timing